MKKTLKIFLSFLLLSVLASAAFCFKPELRFYAKEAVEAFKTEKKLEETSGENFKEIDIKELKYDENCTFNQSLILVNKSNALSADFEADIVRYENTEAFVNTCALDSFAKMREAINEKFGQKLLIMSSYRSRDKQLEIYKSDSDGVAAAPGESEHETGLGIDVYVKYYAGQGFVKSEIGRYVNENCQDFGFIIRYPLGGKASTGFSYEPWHIRFVGLPHSKIIENNRFTLEEYIDNLETGKFYKFENYIISRQHGASVLIPEEYKSITVSPDNLGNYILTIEIA